jgi:hypothetical protein
MLAGLVMLFWAAVATCDLLTLRVDEDGPKSRFLPWPYPVLVAVLGTGAGMFFLTKSLFAHHWISN